MRFDVLTLFPDLIYNYCSESIIGRGQAKNIVSVRAHDFRAFAGNKWGHVDDKSYGGGPGMILRVQPIYECLKFIKAIKQLKQRKQSKQKVIVLDPAGKKFDQRMAEKFSKLDRLVLIAGRYEGFDARVYKFADEHVSVGDFVLAGGELAALAVIEAVSRLILGVLGNPESLVNETFSNHESRIKNYGTSDKNHNSEFIIPDSSLKEYPQYTRPEDFMGQKVPKVLLSGDHRKIAEWRKKKSQ